MPQKTSFSLSLLLKAHWRGLRIPLQTQSFKVGPGSSTASWWWEPPYMVFGKLEDAGLQLKRAWSLSKCYFPSDSGPDSVGGIWTIIEWEWIILHSLNSFSPSVSQDDAFDSPKPHSLAHIILAFLEPQSWVQKSTQWGVPHHCFRLLNTECHLIVWMPGL